MYGLKDYLINGLTHINNSIRPRHKVLTQLMIYATTRCQSQCQHCHIWEKDEEHLSCEDIKRVMDSKCVTSRTVVGLEGGEFVLHPQASEIMSWFKDNHPNYTLLSNCLAVKNVIEMVKMFSPSHLYVSLDGDRTTYRRMRGVDGYNNVIKVVEELRKVVPISLMFCLSPWNSFEDMKYVIDVAKRYDIDVRIGIYGTMTFFDTKEGLLGGKDEVEYIKNIPKSIIDTDENYDFVVLYDEWRNGRLKLPCQSIFSELVIHSNGNVPLCQNLDVSLGNIHTQSLDDIFNSVRTNEAQHCYSTNCNGCWINFHRKYDIVLLRSLEKMFPKRIIEHIYGSYQWSAECEETYKQYFNRIMKI